MSNAPINADAAAAAATATGLRPDQIERAVAEYRSAAEALHVEPNWQAIMHMSGNGIAIAQYVDPAGETKVTLQIDSHKHRGNWVQERAFVLDGTAYETFGEARAAELLRNAKFKPAVVRAPSTNGAVK